MTLITPEYPNSWYRASAELLPRAKQSSRRRFGRCLCHRRGLHRTVGGAAPSQGRQASRYFRGGASRLGCVGAQWWSCRHWATRRSIRTREVVRRRYGQRALATGPGCGRLSRIVRSKNTASIVSLAKATFTMLPSPRMRANCKRKLSTLRPTMVTTS